MDQQSQIQNGWEGRWEPSEWSPALHSDFGQGRKFTQGSPRQGDQVSFHRNYFLQWLSGINRSSRGVFQPRVEFLSKAVRILKSVPILPPQMLPESRSLSEKERVRWGERGSALRRGYTPDSDKNRLWNQTGWDPEWGSRRQPRPVGCSPPTTWFCPIASQE